MLRVLCVLIFAFLALAEGGRRGQGGQEREREELKCTKLRFFLVGASSSNSVGHDEVSLSRGCVGEYQRVRRGSVFPDQQVRGSVFRGRLSARCGASGIPDRKGLPVYIYFDRKKYKWVMASLHRNAHRSIIIRRILMTSHGDSTTKPDLWSVMNTHKSSRDYEGLLHHLYTSCIH